MGASDTRLDEDALRSLRGVLRAASEGERAGSAVELAALASRVGGEVTVDLGATAELGHPLVVVRVPDTPAPDARFSRLSEREREVAGLVAQGLRNRQIARRLFISEGTVKDHVHHILEKTGLPGRAAIAAAWR